MKTGLVLVLGCLLLEASLVCGEEVKKQEKDSKEEDKVVKNSKEGLDKRSNVTIDEGRGTIEDLDNRTLKITVNNTVNIVNNTSEKCNVSTEVNGSSNYSSNITTLDFPLAAAVNVSEEFPGTNFSLENPDEVTDLMDSAAEYFTESITTEEYDPKKFERRSDDGDITFAEDEDKKGRKTSPKIDKEMMDIAFKGDQAHKIKTLLERHNPKKFQRRTFDIMSMLGFKKNNYDAVVKITKEVAVPVPYTVEKKIPVPVRVEVEHPVPVHITKAYPVTVEKKVYYPVKEYVHAPYPVYKKVPYLVKIAVEKPVPVHIEKPYPVYIERKVPYPVEKQVHYPVKIPVDRPIPVKIPVVKNVYYPVEKKVLYPVKVPVEKPVAVPVEKPYPVYVEKEVPVPVETHVPYPIPIEENQPTEDTSHNIEHSELQSFIPSEQTSHNIEHSAFQSFVPSGQIELDYQNNEFGKTEGGFVPIVENHDPTKLQDKKDEELTLEEPQKRENTTETHLQGENKKSRGEVKLKNNEDVQEFGLKLKKT